MKVRFSIPAQWSPDYQQQVHGQIERAFDGIREYAIPPGGGAAGQVLTKNTATDYDFAWQTPGSITANYIPRTTDVWQQSTDNRNRFYFATSGRTYFGSANGYEWRSAADATLATLSDAGALAVTGDFTGANVSASGYVALTNYLYGNGKRALDTSDTWLRLNQNGDFASGVYTPHDLGVGGNANVSGGFTGGADIHTTGGHVYAQTGDVRAYGGFRWHQDTNFYLYNTVGYNYGSWRVGGFRGGYVGVVLDVVPAAGGYPTFMASSGGACGVYFQNTRWAWYDDNTYFRVYRPVLYNDTSAYVKHGGAYSSGDITVSTSAPSGGNNGDIWLMV